MHWRKKWQPTPVFLPGESQGRRSLVGCHLWGCTESDTTELLHFHFPLSCIGEGNGNPLQCSCLENSRHGGTWWAAFYGLNRVPCGIQGIVTLLVIYFMYAAAAAKSLQSCPTLCDPIDGSPPGSPVPGILQARTLEWAAISFSNA